MRSIRRRGATWVTLAGLALGIGALPAVLALGSSSASAATLDGEATVTNQTLSPISSGSSTTEFSLALSADGATPAACSGDTASGGYHVYSYLVEAGTTISSLTFSNHPSAGYGLVNNIGVYYGSQNTALHTGQIASVPTNFEFAPLLNDGVSLSSLLYSGTTGVWDAGLACANSAGTLTDYWNVQVTFTASGGDPNGFVWSAYQVTPTAASVSTAASSSFTDQLTASNASGPVTYSTVTSSSELSVSSSGAVTTTGTLESGDYTVSGTDADTGGDAGPWSFTLSVPLTQAAPTSAPSMTTTASNSFTDQLAVSNPNGTVTYAVTSPVTNVRVSSSGAISTTGPVAAGSHTVSGVDSDSAGGTGTWTFALTVTAVTLTQGAPTSASVTTTASPGFTDQLAVSNANGAVSYAVTSPASGVSVSSSGAITTTGPLAAGTHSVSGTDSDVSGDSGSWSFALTVTAVTLTQGAPTAATVGFSAPTGFADQLAVTDPSGAVSYAVTAPSAGLSVTSSGAVSSTGTLGAGSYTVSGTDSDVDGDSGSWSFTLTVGAPAPDSFTSVSAKQVTEGASFTFQVTTNPSGAKLKSQGALPKGVKFNKATGQYAGTPTATKKKSPVGTYHLTLTATFGKGKTKKTSTQAFTLQVVS